jgi:hypothetical protein
LIYRHAALVATYSINVVFLAIANAASRYAASADYSSFFPGSFYAAFCSIAVAHFSGRRSPRYMRCTPLLLHRGLRIFYLLDFSLRRASVSA